MGCLQITSYLYIFLGIDLCPTAQRSYLGGFSRPKRGWPSKGTRRDKEPVQSGHWAPFERPTNSSWQDEILRRQITTKGWCWSAQHTLRVTLSCPNKGFSSQQRGTEPLSPESSAHSLSHLHHVPDKTPNWPTKSASFQVFWFLGKGKWTYVLEIKLFLALFQPFLNGGNNSLASSAGHTGKGSHSLIFMYKKKFIFPLSFVLPAWWKRR